VVSKSARSIATFSLDCKTVRLAQDGRLEDLRAVALFGAMMAIVLVLSWHTLSDWFSTNALPMLVGMLAAVLLYLPTIGVLWFLDRRARTPLPVVLFILVSIWVFFAPSAGAINDWLSGYLPLITFVGLNEELCKIAPLLIVSIFLPRAISGVRDGLILGALGGLGFAIIEFGYYVAHVGFNDVGWKSLVDQFGRGNFLGIHNHIIWSATLGAALGYAVTTKSVIQKISVPFFAYIAVAALHSFEDGVGNVLTTTLAGMVLEPILFLAQNPEQTMNDNMTLIQLYFGTVNVLLINCLLLPVLWWALRQSGDAERQIIRDALRDEAPTVITPEEYSNVLADQRYRTRRLPGLQPDLVRRILQLQNELAFHKDFVWRASGRPETDASAIVIRQKIAGLRGKDFA
jgi:RsiW-degrading membrane proteinase PrsW (M82 family)